MLICIQKSNGALLPETGGAFYGQTRPADDVPVRSSVAVALRFFADDLTTRVLLAPAAGALTFASQPAAGDTFTIGATTYTAAADATGGANTVALGANLATFAANLIGAVNLAASGGQAAGTTYGTNTTANAQATAAAGSTSNTILFTARAADASGNAVVTTTPSAHASFAAATLTGGDVPNLDIKPQGKYDQTTFTLPTPIFSAPADPTAGDYVGTMSTLVTQAEAVLDPNNPDGTTPDAIEPDDVPLMAQVSWGPLNTPPKRSDEWTINLVNVVRHGGEGLPLPAPGLTLAQVAALVTPYQITTTSGALALPTNVREAIVATGLSGDLSLGLPLAASYSNGQDITITDSAGNSSPGCPVSAVPTGSNHLSGDGEADYTLTGAGKIVLVSNGVDTWSALPRAGIGGVTSANVIGIRKSAGAGSTDTAASGADMASLLAGTNLVPSSLLSATIGSPTGVDLNLIAGTYGSGGSIRIYANGTSIATLNGGTGEAHFNYDVQAGGNLIASGTITGNEVYRTVSGTVTAVVSASGSTPADKVIGCHRIPGAVSLTIPTLGLPQNASREFVIFDADNVGTSNPVTVHVADTGDTKTFSASGFVAHLRISRDVDGGSIFLTVS